MTPPAVSAPPPPAASRAQAPAPAPELRARAPFSRARATRPPLLTGRTVGISFTLHVLLLVAVLLAPAPERRVASAPGDPRPAGPAEVVDYVDVSEWGGMATDPSASLPPPQAAAPTAISAAAADSVLRTLPNAGPFPQRVPTGIPAAPPGPAAGAPNAGVPGAAGGAPGGEPAGTRWGRSGPGGLGPEFGDSRLVVRPQAVPEAPLEDEERYQRHIRGRLQAINDSISGEADRQRRANDWTITDRSGRKWGINERGPVLGGRNVPIPVPLPNARRSREQEDADRRERAQRAEIDRQEEDITRDRYLRERGQAIRERENQRRREEREKQQGGTTP